MIRIQIALVSLVVTVACHRTAPAQRDADVAPVVRDTAGVDAPLKETGLGGVPSAARTFKLHALGQRDSLRATLRKERALWQTGSPRNYQYWLRVGCFCPGTRGWVLMEVRRGQPLRAWDRAGKSVALTDWNTFSIDGLFENLERTVDIDGEVQVAFDPRWHFPVYISTVRRPGPDQWSIIEARALRPI